MRLALALAMLIGAAAALNQTPPDGNAQDLAASRALIDSAERGDTDGVLSALAGGAPINATDERGRTAVMAATHGNQVATVALLLASGADVNIRDNRLDNPFLYAGAEGLLDVLRLTIDAG